jgi:hypothetical protein
VATSFDIIFGIPENENTTITDDAEVRIITDAEGWEILQPVLEQHPDIHIVQENEFIITKGNTILENIYFEAEKIIPIYVGFSFLTQKITENEDNTYNFFVGQKYSSSENHITGAEHFVIHKTTANPFFANAGEDVYADKGETVVLNAAPIGEEALYNWYDESGTLVHEGMEFSPVVTIGQKYTLEVIALSNCLKDYDEVEVKLNPSRIISVYPNPTTNGQITVAYKINDANNAYLKITTSSSRFTYSYVAILDIGANNKTVNVKSFNTGICVVTLYCDGQVVDYKTFVKY